MGCWCVDHSSRGCGINLGVAVGKIMDGWCMGFGQNRWGITVSCGLRGLLEEGTQCGIIGAVVGLYCEVIYNVIVIIVWGVVLQNGKRVVAPCMLLVDRLQESDVWRCRGVTQCGRRSSWGACWRGGNSASAKLLSSHSAQDITKVMGY